MTNPTCPFCHDSLDKHEDLTTIPKHRLIESDLDLLCFASFVLAKEGLFGFTVKMTTNSPSICLCKGKLILLRRSLIGEYEWLAKQEVLHEISHIRAGHGHGSRFHDEYSKLVKVYMGSK